MGFHNSRSRDKLTRSTRLPDYQDPETLNQQNWKSTTKPGSIHAPFDFPGPYGPSSDALSSDSGRVILRDFPASFRTGYAPQTISSQATKQNTSSQAESGDLPLRSSGAAMPDSKPSKNPFDNQLQDMPGYLLGATKYAESNHMSNNVGHGHDGPSTIYAHVRPSLSTSQRAGCLKNEPASPGDNRKGER